MGRGIIRKGDKLTSGGEVITATSTFKVEGEMAARVNDPVSCPLEGHGVNRLKLYALENDPASVKVWAQYFKSTWVLELPASRSKVLEQQQKSFDTAMQVIQ